MRFLFVDAITAVGDASIVGRRHFPASEPMQYRTHAGAAEVAPGAVCEGIGQLASWFCLAANQFTARPVFLFADRIEVLTPVPVGATLELTAEIHSIDSESFRFSGEARLDGQVVQRLGDCSGFFLPLTQLEDPAVAASRYQALTSGGLKLAGADSAPYPFSGLVGEVLALDVGRHIHTSRAFSPSEPFYADHFPRFPVTPIVILNEMIGQATLRMLALGGDGDRVPLRPLAISRIKIRSFVAPGETCEVIVKSSGERCLGTRRLLDTSAELIKDGRRILRGDYHYEIMR